MHNLLVIAAALGIVVVGGYGAYRLGRWTLQPELEDLATRAQYAERLHRRLASELNDERILVARIDAGRPYGLGPDMFADVAASIAVSAGPAEVLVWEFGGDPGETGQWQLPRGTDSYERRARHQLRDRLAQMAEAA